MKTSIGLTLLSLAICYMSIAQAVTIDMIPVGNVGNAGEVQFQGTFGGVSYNYRIGKTEVTNAQYTEFLNAVAVSDPYELYHNDMGGDTRGGITRSDSSGSYSYAVKADAAGQGPGGSNYTYRDKPVVFVSWYDSIRFANWLHNGQGSGDTEEGAYTLLGGTPIPSNGLSITRNSGASWFLPSENEWYKAAYHKNDGVTGNYWDYPTAIDTVPNNNVPSTDTGNSANLWSSGPTTGSISYPLTDAGAYTLSVSPYGTFDQGGNVFEWYQFFTNSSIGGLRGGSWFGTSSELAAFAQVIINPEFEGDSVGFRIASTPHITGDFDIDGDVDGADFLLWQRGESPVPLSQSDITKWESNYGFISTLSLTASVPEPGTLLLGALAAVNLLVRKW
jgi:sulfatase modifying factor 1